MWHFNCVQTYVCVIDTERKVTLQHLTPRPVNICHHVEGASGSVPGGCWAKITAHPHLRRPPTAAVWTWTELSQRGDYKFTSDKSVCWRKSFFARSPSGVRVPVFFSWEPMGCGGFGWARHPTPLSSTNPNSLLAKLTSGKVKPHGPFHYQLSCDSISWQLSVKEVRSSFFFFFFSSQSLRIFFERWNP